ncbi:MAG: carboxypeptidase regulatory-like domain-containing protein, partial [Acidobacteriota bacterium]|nr:carboxypeptidase regulatory-like domain-containing protein [Acidobacteriota bacterium]
INFGDSVNGELKAGDCTNPIDGTLYDAYTFTGTAGQQVVIDMASTAFDAYLYLMRPGETDISPDPNVTVQDDDGGGGTNARITLTLAKSGTYTILADSYGTGVTPGGTGPYTLALSSPGILQLSSAAYSVGEGDGSVTLTVTRTNGSNGAASVGYATSDGTATAGSDYTAASGTLNFADGQTQQTFSVQITDDQIFEPNETFGVALSNPAGGAALGPPSSATVTIIENDACGYTLPQPGRTVVAAGGQFTDSYHTLVGCPAPVVTSNSAFITSPSATKPDPSGNGTFSYTAAQNANSAQRAGTLTVADKTFTVTQTGVACSFSLQSSGQPFTSAGGPGSVVVNASASDCSWTAKSNADWITINSGASGTGGGAVGFTVAANPNSAQRAGTITAAGQTFTVTQTGVSCSFSLSPPARSFASDGGSDSVSVTAAPSDCQWTASTGDNWITINSGKSGTGGGAVGYTVAANPNSAQRSGAITIAGQTFNVTQSGVSCTFTLSPPSQSFGASADTGGVTVTAAAQDCRWTAASNVNWITITSGTPGAGNGTVAFSVASNPNGASRTGTLTVAGQTFTVSQDFATYSIVGHVSDPSPSPLPGVAVRLDDLATNTSRTTTTDSRGDYSFANLAAGAGYAVTPSKALYTFAPQSLSFPSLSGDQTGANFTATLNTFAVSGRVTTGAGAPLPGVAVTMSGGASGAAATDTSGAYSFSGVPAGASVTVTPALAGYTFAPAQRSINVDGDRPGTDFVASPLPTTLQFSQAQYTVSEGGGRAAVTVTRSGDTSTSVTVDVRTVDDPAAVPCGDTTTKPGVAFARCDYATVAGTLTFNAGETQKAFTVPVIDDSWVEPTETFR